MFTFLPVLVRAGNRHPLGQILHITAGAGLAQQKGATIVKIRAGDAVKIEPGEWYWHGAGPRTFMTHLTVQEASDDMTEAERGEHVSDAEYPS